MNYDSESKEYDAEAHRDRIFRKNVTEYMRNLKEGDEDVCRGQFSKIIANGVRVNPDRKRKRAKKIGELKRFMELSLESRRKRVVEKRPSCFS
ncbi:unnamed protein product [Heligmosomoides polygyrus]|uniref:Ribosomal_L18_c domain-containing protein n=1 Tax=Heligmosomoides polygyrus TaxID=6339 RepID=A0A183GSJ9_HELPZ|nr:unnamed protein product [Heligmosomoides polygyrus]